jgi:hypothetical protein
MGDVLAAIGTQKEAQLTELDQGHEKALHDAQTKKDAKDAPGTEHTPVEDTMAGTFAMQQYQIQNQADQMINSVLTNKVAGDGKMGEAVANKIA